MMKKGERVIYYDIDLQIELYEFKGIVQDFNKHFHNEYIIGLIEEGKREFYCKDKRYFLNAGDILLINPYEIHSCKQFEKQDLCYFSFNINMQIMRKMIKEITGSEEILYFKQNVINTKEKDLKLLFYDLQNMVINKEESLKKEEVFILLLKYLFENFTEAVTNDENMNKRYNNIKNSEFERIEKICKYMQENFYRNICLDELSLLAKINKYHLIHSFTAIKKISPHKYLEAIRIENSKRFLEQGFSIVEIASKTGFVDQAHFTKLFKSLTGLTPKMYQKILRKY